MIRPLGRVQRTFTASGRQSSQAEERLMGAGTTALRHRRKGRDHDDHPDSSLTR